MNNLFSINPEAAQACIEATRQAVSRAAQQWTHCPALQELAATMREQIRKTRQELLLLSDHALQEAARQARATLPSSAAAAPAAPTFQRRRPNASDDLASWPAFITLSE